MIEHACAWHLPDDERVAHHARTLTSMTLSSMNVEDEGIETATVMASELATNAYQHARPPYGLRIWCGGAVAVVEVFDSSQTLPPIHEIPSSVTATGEIMMELEEHGRGLPLVRYFSGGRCGTDRLALGTTAKKTWFALPRALHPCEVPRSLTPTMLASAPSLAQLSLAGL